MSGHTVRRVLSRGEGIHVVLLLLHHHLLLQHRHLLLLLEQESLVRGRTRVETIQIRNELRSLCLGHCLLRRRLHHLGLLLKDWLLLNHRLLLLLNHWRLRIGEAKVKRGLLLRLGFLFSHGLTEVEVIEEVNGGFRLLLLWGDVTSEVKEYLLSGLDRLLR